MTNVPHLLAEKGKREQATCYRGLRDIGVAHLMYAREHEEMLVPADGWPDRLRPYVEDPSLYTCPADDRRPPVPVSYTMSADCGAVEYGTIRWPGRVPLAYDGVRVAGGVHDATFRHQGGLNCIYVDGHVTWLGEDSWSQFWRTPQDTFPPPRYPGTTPRPLQPSDPGREGHSEEDGHANRCLSNLYHIGIALRMYAVDWDYAPPPAERWPEALGTYVDSDDVYVCPSDPGPHRSEIDGFGLSYTLNDALRHPRIRSRRGVPDEPLIFDGAVLTGGPESATFRHEDELFVCFTDGHVKHVARDEWDALWEADSTR